MRVDRVIKDALRSLRQALQALDSNITVQDNFGPAGAEADSVIVSVGRQKKPVWKKLTDLIDTSDLKGDPGEPGAQGISGAPGAQGPPGEDATCEDCGTVAEPLIDAITGELILAEDEVGDLDVIMVCTEEVC